MGQAWSAPKLGSCPASLGPGLTIPILANHWDLRIFRDFVSNIGHSLEQGWPKPEESPAFFQQAPSLVQRCKIQGRFFEISLRPFRLRSRGFFSILGRFTRSSSSSFHFVSCCFTLSSTWLKLPSHLYTRKKRVTKC